MLLYLVCAKWSELITEVNRISVQQLPFCLPLCHVVLSSEVLNSSIKNCFEGVVFQDAVCEECFSISLWCLYLQCVCDCFDESFIIKIILVSGFLLFICINQRFKLFGFDTGFHRDSCAVSLLKALSRLPKNTTFFCLIVFLIYNCNH